MTLEQRVRKLEQENRWMRRIAAVAVAAAAAVVLVGQADDELPELVARSVTIKDKAGHERAVLSTSKEGNPALWFMGNSSGQGAMLTINEVAFWANAKQRAVLGIRPSDGRAARLLLCDAAGEPRVTLGITGEDPHVDLRDGRGKPRVSLGIDRERPGLHLLDAAGTVRLLAQLAARGDGQLALRGADKDVTWQVPAK